MMHDRGARHGRPDRAHPAQGVLRWLVDSYAIDVCFGDEVLERTLDLLADLDG